jgi:pimeloyl-ACP methyl ester carboxylesterase
MHPDFEHHFEQVTSAHLHYVRAGNPHGHKVLLVHGWPETWYAWRHIINELVRDGRFDVIAPDLRGLGDSSRPLGPYDKWTVAGDLAELVNVVWPGQPILAVGHDWGGVVAFNLTVQLGAAVTGLAVLDATIPLPPQAGTIDSSQGGRRWHHAFHQAATLPEQLIAGREREYYSWFYSAFASPSSTPIPESTVDEYLRCYGTAEGTRAGLAYYRAIPEDQRRHASLPRPAIQAPVLAVGGDSGAGRHEEPGLSLSQFADDVTTVVVPNCGHWMMEEQPEAVGQLILDFAQRTLVVEGAEAGPNKSP